MVNLSPHDYPMNVLMKKSGDRYTLKVKPKDAVPRKFIKRKGAAYTITDADSIRIKPGLYYAEIKEQGHCYFFIKWDENTFGLFGKNTNVNGEYVDILSKIESCKAIKRLMLNSKIPNDTVIALELIVPGKPDSEVSHAMAEKPSDLDYVAFGLPIFQSKVIYNNKVSYLWTRKKLQKMLNKKVSILNSHKFEIKSNADANAVICKLLKQAQQAKVEGYVLKQYGYNVMYKVKGVKELDCFVTGFKVSSSDTRSGMVTSVLISAYDHKNRDLIPLGSITGFDLPTIMDMTVAFNMSGETKRNKFYLRPLRVLYQEVAAKGGLKHGFFDCWRNDKNTGDCVVDL